MQPMYTVCKFIELFELEIMAEYTFLKKKKSLAKL